MEPYARVFLFCSFNELHTSRVESRSDGQFEEHRVVQIFLGIAEYSLIIAHQRHHRPPRTCKMAKCLRISSLLSLTLGFTADKEKGPARCIEPA